MRPAALLRALALAAGSAAAAASAAPVTPDGAAPEAAPALTIRVTVSTQTMSVARGGELLHVWRVSTARPGKVTPRGTFHPQILVRFHRSRLYNNAPMPWSIFFHGNYAIHGTTEVARLGRPASAGCIRLAPEHAERLFALVGALEKSDTAIVIAD
jgi:lipoprotein-anchoring transpeptidase ErfK/SrfK